MGGGMNDERKNMNAPYVIRFNSDRYIDTAATSTLSMFDGPHGNAAVNPYVLSVAAPRSSNAARTSASRRLKFEASPGVPP